MRLASTGSRLRTSRLIFRTTSTSSGIGCRPAATFRRRCGGWIYRRAMAGRGRWEIPTVADRIAQMVVKRHLEPMVEPNFHPDSYGYRPGKSALDAIGGRGSGAGGTTGFLISTSRPSSTASRDTADEGGAQAHRLPVGAAIHREMAEGAGADGGRKPHRAGKRNAAGRGDQPAPGEPLSALCVRSVDATELSRTFRSSAMPTMRSATAAARRRRRRYGQSLDGRFTDCGLTLHPEKTKIVYCKDEDRRGDYPDHQVRLSRLYIPAEAVRRKAGRRSASRSVPRPATRRSKRSEGRSEAGRCTTAATSRWTIWRGCSTRTSAAGSTTTAASTNRRFIRPCGTSIASWLDGLDGSSSASRHQRRSRHWLERIARRQPRLFAHWTPASGRGWTMGAV